MIGIVGVLVAILLPALSRARESANALKCAANLHFIGQGIAAYVADSRGTLPASNTWKYLHLTADQQDPTTPVYGTVHWSSYLYGGRAANDGTDQVYRSLAGWDAFQCPSLPRGGLPPANTFPGNSDLPNEATGTDPYTGRPVIDAQAPRLAYTLNEALCPRGYLLAGVTAGGSMVERPYRFVRAGSVRNSSSTVLATELWGSQALAVVPSSTDPGGGVLVSGARRPVSGFTHGLVGPTDLWQLPLGVGKYAALLALDRVDASYLDPDPTTSVGAAGAYAPPRTTLDWVGRNHGGRRRLGTAPGGGRAVVAGVDQRTTNFLYLDGHVETKHLWETLAPAFQWGVQFYSLTGGERVSN